MCQLNRRYGCIIALQCRVWSGKAATDRQWLYPTKSPEGCKTVVIITIGGVQSGVKCGFVQKLAAMDLNPFGDWTGSTDRL